MKLKLKLILPNKKYATSYFQVLQALRREGNNTASARNNLFNSMSDFDSWNKRIIADRKGLNIEKDRVPQTLFLGVVGKKVVGKLSIRHRLNKQLKAFGGHIGYTIIPAERGKGYAKEMLRLGLKKARKLGIKKVLIGCYEGNVPSKKVIEANGGVLIKKFKKDGRYSLHFLVDNK